ncbi:hypothetical protein M8J75_000585 [Diaphorina citri]|nr:hypothetical protein M8J75_000585 [Diaphorina citri]
MSGPASDFSAHEDWNIEQSDDFEVEDPSAEIEDVQWNKNNREPPPLEKPWSRKNINTEWSKTSDEYIHNNLNNRNNRIDEPDNRYSKNALSRDKDACRNVNRDIDIKRNIVNREYLPKESNRVERQPSRIEKDRNLVDVNRNLRRVDSNERANQIGLGKNNEKSLDRDLFVREVQHKSNFMKTNSNSNLFASRNENVMSNEEIPSFVKQMKSTQDQFEKNYEQRHIGKNYYENRQRSPSPDETSPRDRFIDAKQKFKLLEKERLEEEKKLIQQNIEKKIKERERPISPVPVNKNNVRRSWSVESEEKKPRDNRVRNKDIDDRYKRNTEYEIEERNRRNWEDDMKRKNEDLERERILQEKERLARQRYKENQVRNEIMMKNPGRYAPEKSSRESSASKEYFGGKEVVTHQSKAEQVSHARERSYQDIRHVSESPTRGKDKRRESPTRAYNNYSRDSPTRGVPFRERPIRDSPTRSVSSWDLPFRESPARALPTESPSKKLSPREMLMRDAQEVRALHDMKVSKEVREKVLLPGKYPAKEQLKKLSSRDSQSPIRESSRSSHSPVRDYPRNSQSPVMESHIKYSPRNVPLESIPLERYRSPTRFDSPKSLGFEVSKPYEDSPRPHHEVTRSFDARGRDVPARSFDYDIQGRGEISRQKILESQKKGTPDPIEEEKRRYSQELAKEFKRKSMLNLTESNSHVSSSSYQELQEHERYPGLDKEPVRSDRFDRDPRLDRPVRMDRDRMSDDERDPRVAHRNRMARNVKIEREPFLDPRVGRDLRMEREPRPEREYREHIRDPRLEMRDHRRYDRDPRYDPDPRLAQHNMNSPRYRHSYAEAYHRDLQRTNSCLSSGRVGIASIHPY